MGHSHSRHKKGVQQHPAVVQQEQYQQPVIVQYQQPVPYQQQIQPTQQGLAPPPQVVYQPNQSYQGLAPPQVQLYPQTIQQPIQPIQQPIQTQQHQTTQIQQPNVAPPNVQLYNQYSNHVVHDPHFVQQQLQQLQQQQQMDGFSWFFQKHNISSHYRNDLMTLGMYDIILILDDSGSMKTKTKGNQTRWGELKEMSIPIIDLGSLLDSDGIDVIFLNRGHKSNVKSINDIQGMFNAPPDFRTPLSSKLRLAMSLAKGKPQLIIIMTDGQPYTVDDKYDKNYDSVDVFTQVLEFERNSDMTFVSILKCSTDDDETGYLDVMDKVLDNLDVISNYEIEKAQVQQKQGEHFIYTPGDNIARLLLGSIFDKYDKMDEIFIE